MATSAFYPVRQNKNIEQTDRNPVPAYQQYSGFLHFAKRKKPLAKEFVV